LEVEIGVVHPAREGGAEEALHGGRRQSEPVFKEALRARQHVHSPHGDTRKTAKGLILALAPAGAGTYCDRPRVFTRLVRVRERSRFLAPVRIGFPQNFNSLRGAAQMTRERSSKCMGDTRPLYR